MSKVTGWVLGHKRLVIAAWVVLALAGGVMSGSLSSSLTHSFAVPGREGYETNQQIARLYGSGGGRPPLVPVVALPAGTTVDSPGTKAQLQRALAAIGASLPGSRTVSFASTGNRLFVSSDGRTTFGLVYPRSGIDPELPAGALAAASRAASAVTVAGAPVRLTGIDALTRHGGAGGPGVLVEALLGGVGALIVLAFVFGSLISVVPIVIAVVSILTTFLLIGGLSSVTSVSFVVQYLVALIGLGVSIDYALLVVVRWREERLRGAENEAAVRIAMRTAGRAVIFSGTTVGIGLLALVVLPIPFLRSVGYAGLLIPIVTVMVASTLLPVILATVGPRLDRRRMHAGERADRAWARWAEGVVRHRWLGAAVALLVLAALAVPALRMYPGEPRADALASTGSARQALVTLERAGISAGALTPFEGLVMRNKATATAAIANTQLGVRGAVAPTGAGWQRRGRALIEVIPKADGNSSAGRSALSIVRNATHRLPGAPQYGGQAAQAKDFVNAVYGNFPLMLALIVVVSFLLLARAFRSLLLPVKAVLLNLLSVSATYGLLVLIWQDGHGSNLIWGIKATGAITQFVPLMVFAFLFGLSMDYEVFILSRIREEYDATGDTRQAIIHGIARTGRLITSAALILFLAFVSLASGPDTNLKIFATGLALGILLDATIVRSLLVPALLAIFGRWNWWMPPGLARLLRIRHLTRRADTVFAAEP
jgi:RND superfamily putative drug exporter